MSEQKVRPDSTGPFDKLADGSASQAPESMLPEAADPRVLDAAPHGVTPPTAPELMGGRLRLGIGVYLIVFGFTLLATILWAWSFTSRLIGGSSGGAVAAHFFGVEFTPTADFSLLLIVLLTAMLGSVAVLALTFSSRAGHGTLERTYAWWYLTRPITSAGLGLLLYMAIMAGFFSASTIKDRPALVVAAAIGGLAGLFTDQVLKKMRSILALLPTGQIASDKDEAST